MTDDRPMEPGEGSGPEPAPSAGPASIPKIRCPQCGHVQERHPVCSACNVNIPQYVAHLRAEAASAAGGQSAPSGQGGAQGAAFAFDQAGASAQGQAGERKFPDIDSVMRRSWEMYKERFWVLMGLTVFGFMGPLIAIVICMAFGFGMIGDLIERGGDPSVGEVGTVLVLLTVGVILAFYVSCVFMAATTHALKDRTAGLGVSIGRGFRQSIAYVWLYFLVMFVIGGGLVVFLVPGLVFLVWFWPALIILVAEGRGGMDALVRAKAYVAGQTGEVALRLLVLFALYIVAGFVPILGQLLFIPFMSIFLYLTYLDLKEEKDPDFEPETSGTWKWMGVAIVGNLVPVVLLVLLALKLMDTGWEGLPRGGIPM